MLRVAAAEHLNAAGLRPDASGMRARLRYLHPPGAPWDAVFAVLRGGLRQVGMEVTAEPVSAAEWLRRVAAGAYEITGFATRQTGDAATDLAAYAGALPALAPLLAAGPQQLGAAQMLAVTTMPVVWLAEPGCPVARDRRIAIPGGILGDFVDARPL